MENKNEDVSWLLEYLKAEKKHQVELINRMQKLNDVARSQFGNELPLDDLIVSLTQNLSIIERKIKSAEEFFRKKAL